MASSVWEAACYWCGEAGLTVKFYGQVDDSERIGVHCPTCKRDGVIAYQLRAARRRKRKT